MWWQYGLNIPKFKTSLKALAKLRLLTQIWIKCLSLSLIKVSSGKYIPPPEKGKLLYSSFSKKIQKESLTTFLRVVNAAFKRTLGIESYPKNRIYACLRKLLWKTACMWFILSISLRVAESSEVFVALISLVTPAAASGPYVSFISNSS